MAKKSAKSRKDKKKKEKLLKSPRGVPCINMPGSSQTATPVSADDIEMFVKKSLIVSGIRKGHPEYGEMGDMYAEICRIQLYSHDRKVLDPRLVHYALLNNGRSHDAGELRSGVSDLELGFIPKSECIAELVEAWVRDARTFVERIQDESCEEDRRCGDELVLRLICIKPFDRANGRVARLYDNVFRVWCGFPWHIPSSADRAENGNGPVARYREEIFIPRYGKYL